MVRCRILLFYSSRRFFATLIVYLSVLDSFAFA